MKPQDWHHTAKTPKEQCFVLFLVNNYKNYKKKYKNVIHMSFGSDDPALN